MEKDFRARLKQLLESGQARLQPLTLTQRELWENSPVKPSDTANHICSFFEVKGPVTYEQIEEAVRRVANRQEAMRTSFLPGKNGPLQFIRSTGRAVVRYRELESAEKTPEGLAEVMQEGFREPFDFTRGPLYRMDMLKRGPDDYILPFTIHHAVADGWTLGAYVDDLTTACLSILRDGGLDLGNVEDLRQSIDPVPMSYSEWGATERARWTQQEIAKFSDYWKERLAGSSKLWDKVSDEDRGAVPLETWVTSLPPELAKSARELARKTGTTLFSTLLTAFQITLCRRTGIDDIVVGSPVANRNRPAVRETMGYFAGIVPLRSHVDLDRPFVDQLKGNHEETIDAFAHAIPFAELAKLVGEPPKPGQHTIFDTRFALQNHPIPDFALPGVSTRLRTISTGTTRFDLACELTEVGDEFEVVWLYRPSIVPAGDVHELDALYREILTHVCRQPDILPASMTV